MKNKIVKVKKNKQGEGILDLETFKDFLNISKIIHYKLEPVHDSDTDNTALLITFYDKDKNIISAEKD